MTSHAAQTVTVTTTDADGTRALGARVAALLRRGDLVMLSGGLGAGKTTLAQGIGSALNVRGRVSSPTFIIARVTPPWERGRTSSTSTPTGCPVWRRLMRWTWTPPSRSP